jgi:AAA lid domain
VSAHAQPFRGMVGCMAHAPFHVDFIGHLQVAVWQCQPMPEQLNPIGVTAWLCTADRFLPDKAIDLVDEAAARLKMEATSKPEALDEIERKVR